MVNVNDVMEKDIIHGLTEIVRTVGYAETDRGFAVRVVARGRFLFRNQARVPVHIRILLAIMILTQMVLMTLVVTAGINVIDAAEAENVKIAALQEECMARFALLVKEAENATNAAETDGYPINFSSFSKASAVLQALFVRNSINILIHLGKKFQKYKKALAIISSKAL